MNETSVKGSDLTLDWLEKRRSIMAEIDRQLILGLNVPGKGLSLEQLQISAVEHRNAFAKKGKPSLLSMLNIGHVTKEDLGKLSIWDLKMLYALFYEQVFGLLISFPNELMPEASSEFAWLICIPGIISNEAAYRSGKSELPKWKCTNDPLDKVIQLDRGRDSWTHSYIVRTPADFEAGGKWKNISGNDIDKKGVNVLTFRERWILGLFIYWLTGEQLDRNVVTGTGSRNSVGFVVSVYWIDGRLYVYWCSPDHALDFLRSREVVS